MSDFLKINDKDLDLEGLSSFLTYEEGEFEKRRIIREKEQEQFKKKYGKDWFSHWWKYRNPTPDYDLDMKEINIAIYRGHIPSRSGTREFIRMYQKKVENRMFEIYGDEMYDLVYHKPNDPNINERLIRDAMKTGKWKELPDCLQDEYHKRIKKCELH